MNQTPKYARALNSEPKLRNLERVIRALAALNPMPGTVYDAVIYPLASPLVGWRRGQHFHAHNPEDMPTPISKSTEGERTVALYSLADYPTPIATVSQPATTEEAWLRTREAFDAVTNVWLDHLTDAEDPDRPYCRI